MASFFSRMYNSLFTNAKYVAAEHSAVSYYTWGINHCLHYYAYCQHSHSIFFQKYTKHHQCHWSKGGCAEDWSCGGFSSMWLCIVTACSWRWHVTEVQSRQPWRIQPVMPQSADGWVGNVSQPILYKLCYSVGQIAPRQSELVTTKYFTLRQLMIEK